MQAGLGKNQADAPAGERRASLGARGWPADAFLREVRQKLGRLGAGVQLILVMMNFLKRGLPVKTEDWPAPVRGPVPRVFAEAEQQELTALCAQTGLMLMQHGAESALVESVARRLGLALGLEGVEVALMANGLMITTIAGGRGQTTVRRNLDRGINMQMVTEVQRAVLDAEAGRLDQAGVARRLAELKPLRYNRWLVSAMVGLSCAAFARLILQARGLPMDAGTAVLTFAASAVAMHVRQWLGQLHFNPLVNFAAAAFVATSIAAQGVIHGWVAQPKITMAACVLLFVPGFPLINAVSDMVKGYINVGISRGVMAVMLLLASCGGIVLAMTVWNTWTWL